MPKVVEQGPEFKPLFPVPPKKYYFIDLSRTPNHSSEAWVSSALSG
jgi:hypothetical protein